MYGLCRRTTQNTSRLINLYLHRMITRVLVLKRKYNFLYTSNLMNSTTWQNKNLSKPEKGKATFGTHKSLKVWVFMQNPLLTMAASRYSNGIQVKFGRYNI